MMKTLNYLWRSSIFCLAFLACVLALSSGSTKAADTESFVTPSFAADATTADVPEGGSCLWGGSLVQGCVFVENPDEYIDSEIEADSFTEIGSPVAETGAAILVEVTQSTTIAAPGETTETEAPVTVADYVDLPTVLTGYAILFEITQSITIAVPGDITEEEHGASEIVSEAVAPQQPPAQTGAAIIVQITQSAMIAVPGQPPEADQQVSAAALPEDDEE